mmetsp:Transcript_18722/g.52670  ORF Transcript_18722/g.52670 Transcript_18722/m.52670 type:complete len:155 (+) Transcript_18722:157-621(+)
MIPPIYQTDPMFRVLSTPRNISPSRSDERNGSGRNVLEDIGDILDNGADIPTTDGTHGGGSLEAVGVRETSRGELGISEHKHLEYGARKGSWGRRCGWPRGREEELRCAVVEAGGMAGAVVVREEAGGGQAPGGTGTRGHVGERVFGKESPEAA